MVKWKRGPELPYETTISRRESRRQVCCTTIVASIATIATFVGTFQALLGMAYRFLGAKLLPGTHPVPRTGLAIPRTVKGFPGSTKAPRTPLTGPRTI